MPLEYEPKPDPGRPSRRRVLIAGATGGVGVWAAPQILSTGRASAGVILHLEIEPITCGSVPTTQPLPPLATCIPAVWPTGAHLAKGDPVDWVIDPHVGITCINGMKLTILHPSTTIVSAHADQICTDILGNEVLSCIHGTIDGTGTVVDYPNNLGGDGCVYTRFRIELDLEGSA